MDRVQSPTICSRLVFHIPALPNPKAHGTPYDLTLTPITFPDTARFYTCSVGSVGRLQLSGENHIDALPIHLPLLGGDNTHHGFDQFVHGHCSKRQ